MTKTDPRQLLLFDASGRPLNTCRGDALPEQTRYRDEGCELAPSCLNCPLPLCRYDLPGGVRRQRLRTRDDAIIRLRRVGGLPVEEIARRFGLSRRSVFRVLQRAQTPIHAKSSCSESVEEGFSPPHRLPHSHSVRDKEKTVLRVETLSMPPSTPSQLSRDASSHLMFKRAGKGATGDQR